MARLPRRGRDCRTAEPEQARPGLACERMTSSAPDPAGGDLPAHVLIVEDEPLLALALEDALRHAGIARVDVCGSTSCAMETLRSGHPDAIVLDVHLADRDDGWAIAELLRSLGPGAPKVVFSTGSPDAIPPEIAALGPVLAKPYAPAALVEALRAGTRPGLMARLRDRLR